MGWRDINMNRRKPRIDVAVVPMGEGEERAAAVLRKAVNTALAWVREQGAANPAFTAGYVAGFARHQALKHGLASDVVQALQLVPRKAPSSRAGLAAADPLADAGYLVGHLESLCGTKRLLATGGDVEAYLTLCDHAADRLQTHHPTDVLRLDPAERAVVRAALVRP